MSYFNGRIAAALALLTLLVVLAAGMPAGEKERLLFRARAADTYPARDAHEGLVVAADLFDSREETKAVFGKLDPMKAGFLPVLLVMTNTTDKTVRLDNLSVRLITADRQKLEPTPAETVMTRMRGKAPGMAGPKRSPLPRLSRGPGSGIEIQVHEFNLRMSVPNSTVSGFFYFDIGRRREALAGAKLFVTELVWAHNGQPLMFFEMPLDPS